MDGTGRKTHKWRRRLLIAAVAVVFAAAAFVLSIPFLLTHVPIPVLELDASPYLKGKAAELVSSKKATADIDIMRGKPERAEGDLALTLDGTDWKAYADFSVRGKRDWSFTASIPETHVTQDNEVLASILSRAVPPSISNLVFSGTFKLDASGECTPGRPVPAWTARCSLSDVDASLVAGGKPARIECLRSK